jgi:23S rRNA (pseudouridine1915-N3)-methyltransferase
MRVLIAAIGRARAGPERELVTRYLDRAAATGRNVALTGFKLAELPESRAASPSRRRREEAAMLTGAMPEGAVSVALDERGKALTSAQLADGIGSWRDAGTADLGLIIGGPDGLDPSLRDRAQLVLALSALTWPHQLARVMLAEQLYRAATILAGHPYHRGD